MDNYVPKHKILFKITQNSSNFIDTDFIKYINNKHTPFLFLLSDRKSSHYKEFLKLNSLDTNIDDFSKFNNIVNEIDQSGSYCKHKRTGNNHIA